MTKRLQELPQITTANTNDWVLIKQFTGASDIDYKISFQDFSKSFLQTSDVGVGVGQVPALINGSGGGALPQISGEFLTNIDAAVSEANETRKGIVRLSDSVISTANVNSGFAATPQAVKEAYDLADAAVKRDGDLMSGNLEFVNNMGLQGTTSGTGIPPAGTKLNLIKVDSDDDIILGNTGARLGLFVDDPQQLWTVTELGNPAKQYRIFNEGFMGAGSGLDADLLDGVQGSAFGKLSGNQTWTGANTFSKNVEIVNPSNAYISVHAGTNRNSLIRLSEANKVHGAYILYNGSDDNVTYFGTRSNNADKHFMSVPRNSNVVDFKGTPTVNGNQVGVLSNTQTWTGGNTYIEDVTINGKGNPTISTGSLRLHGFSTNNTGIAITGDGTSSTRIWKNAADELMFTNASGTNGIKIPAGISAIQTFAGETYYHQGNDGAGSGLDADLLDGVQGSAFGKLGNTQTWTGANTWTGKTTFTERPEIKGVSPTLIMKDTNSTGAAQTSFISFQDNAGNEQAWVGYGTGANSSFYIRNSQGKVTLSSTEAVLIDSGIQITRGINLGNFITVDGRDFIGVNQGAGAGGAYIGGYDNCWLRTGNATEQPKVVRNGGNHVLWHAGNDGSGSGLDADLLDGQQGSYYAVDNANFTKYSVTVGGTISEWIPVRLPTSSTLSFVITSPGGGSSNPLNYNVIEGSVGIGGWSDKPTYANIYKAHYVDGENAFWRMMESSQSANGVILYVRGGRTYNIQLKGNNGTPSAYVNGYQHSSSNFPVYNTSGNVIRGGSSANINTFVDFSTGTTTSSRWGHYSTGSFEVRSDISASGNISAYSDRRLKKDIEVIPDALDKVCKLSGYTYERTDMETSRQTGVIAQEVLEVLPEAVTGSEESIYAVSYGNMVGLLIEAVKELRGEVKTLKAQLNN